MPCQEIAKAIAWNKKTSSKEQFPVVAYFTKHFGSGSTPASVQQRDAIHCAIGNVLAFDSPSPHLAGTLKAHKNSSSNTMVADPTLTYEIKLFPDGTLSYLMKLNGNPVGGLPPTKVTATCVNDVLLTAVVGSEVVAVGVATQPSVQLPA